MRDTEDVCNLARNCHKSKVIAKPEKGKAILWYNHHVDNSTKWMGQLDFYSFHGGCDVREGRKWIANNWISVGNNRARDIQNWIQLAPSDITSTESTHTETKTNLGTHTEL